MAWNSPANYSEGQLITPTIWNAQIYDNMTWLKTPPSNRMAIVTQNTASASFVAVTGVSLAITTEGGSVLIRFCGSFYNTGVNNNFLDFGIDGAGVGDATNGLQYFTTPVANYRSGIGFEWVSGALSAAAHTVTLRWKTTAGTLTMENGGQFSVREV